MDSTIFEMCSNDTIDYMVTHVVCLSQAKCVEEIRADPNVDTSDGVIDHNLISNTKASLDEAVNSVIEGL